MRISTKTMVTIGMFTAVLSVLSILTIPMPSGVPMTLQTFAMALCGYVLEWKKGAAVTFIYILLGCVGIPVFAGMTGGVSHLFSYTGGFIWGFVVFVICCGFSIKQKSMIARIFLGGMGLAICHLIGVIHFSIVAETRLAVAFVTVSMPYLPKDVISMIGAYAVAMPVRKALLEHSR